jgi:hypothetical protein
MFYSTGRSTGPIVVVTIWHSDLSMLAFTCVAYTA